MPATEDGEQRGLSDFVVVPGTVRGSSKLRAMQQDVLLIFYGSC